MKKLKNKGITLVALVITIIILLILAGITISQLTGSGLFENAKLAKEKSEKAQEKEKWILSDYENKIGEYVAGDRESELEQEIEKLNSEINSIKTMINNLQYSVIINSNIDVEYNTVKKIYSKEFSEDKLICYTAWGKYDSYSNGTFNYRIYAILNGKMINDNSTAEVNSIDACARPTISQVLSVKKGDILEFYLYQAGESGKNETINIEYNILGNF